MNKNIKVLIGFKLKETDGEIGKIEDFYFDDISWRIRYLVVKTGNWFTGHKVLISPKSLQQPDWENEEFSVNLTKDQIINSPEIDTEKPVSRQQEEQLYKYYPWGTYWGSDPYAIGGEILGATPGGLYAGGAEIPEERSLVSKEDNDQHLRSTDKITGYKIHATDGEIGKVVDYIIDETTWKIKYFIVESGNWLDSRKVLLSTQWIHGVSWENSKVIVDVSMDEVKNSPEFDINLVLNESYERTLYDYYGKPGRG